MPFYHNYTLLVTDRVLLGKPEGRRPLGRPRPRLVDNIRMDLQEVGCGYMDWIVPTLQEAGYAPGLVCTGVKFRPHRDSIPNRQARSQSLYQLTYPAH